jgi:hypothetical protein
MHLDVLAGELDHVLDWFRGRVRGDAGRRLIREFSPRASPVGVFDMFVDKEKSAWCCTPSGELAARWHSGSHLRFGVKTRRLQYVTFVVMVMVPYNVKR